MTREVPYVPKKAVTIVVVGDSFEAGALRAVLENLNYRVTVHWVGSRKEFLMLLDGQIPVNDEIVVLSCHGIDQGIDVPSEEPVSPQEISDTAKLPNKTIVNLGCKTGSIAFQEAFLHAGVAHYIGPDDYPEGSAAMVFTVNLFYLLRASKTLHDAVAHASGIDAETSQFKIASQQ